MAKRTMRAFLVLVMLIATTALTIPATHAAPASPSGRLAYTGRDGRLHVVNADGSGDQALPTRGAAYSPNWSRTGEIVYEEAISSSRQLAVIDPASGLSRVLVAPELRFDSPITEYWSYGVPQWTADAAAVIYRKQCGCRGANTINRVSFAGGTPQVFPDSGPLMAAGTFAVSPTASRLAVTQNGLDHNAGGSRVLVCVLDASDCRTLIPLDKVFYSNPAWTADGSAIALTQSTGSGDTGTLFLLNPDTGAQSVLGTIALKSSYAFSPDGKWLAFASGADGQLLLINLADLRDQRPLGYGYSPTWEPGPLPFPQTGQAVGGRFLRYWQAHGGLALFGYPLTGERQEKLEDGKTYTVQYFERARFEYHPENAAPNDVLLGQFGRLLHPADPPAAQQPGATFFAATGHNVGGSFLAYWQANGGLAQFGYPLSEEFTETLEDGQPYTVQYFERARFEHHPENAAPNDVLLGQFGRRVLDQRR
jgi:hypothetical protein